MVSQALVIEQIAEQDSIVEGRGFTRGGEPGSFGVGIPEDLRRGKRQNLEPPVGWALAAEADVHRYHDIQHEIQAGEADARLAKDPSRPVVDGAQRVAAGREVQVPRLEQLEYLPESEEESNIPAGKSGTVVSRSHPEQEVQGESLARGQELPLA